MTSNEYKNSELRSLCCYFTISRTDLLHSEFYSSTFNPLQSSMGELNGSNQRFGFVHRFFPFTFWL